MMHAVIRGRGVIDNQTRDHVNFARVVSAEGHVGKGPF